MKIEFSASGLVLAAGQLLNLDDAEGVRIGSLDGTIWITQDGDRRDIVLAAGESFEIDRSTPVIVQAMEAAVVTIAERAAPRPVKAVHLTQGLRTAVRQLGMQPACA